jgi:UDP-N-acetylmuramoyl-tripeptide--D-alanyl-D-alanine ligase
MQIESLYQIYLNHPSVQTDTRQLKSGDLFFALKGPNFNGNLFADKALEQGASFAVADEYSGIYADRVILVQDVLDTLQALALHHRKQFRIPFIAITGSNGKTTTKELVHAVLSTHYRTYTTRGNLNNHIGIPLTILGIRSDAEIAVIEMGANHQGEIAGYCQYALPTHGIITNAGKAHLEGFGGFDGVKKGKGELFDFMRSQGGSAFVMWDYNYLREMSVGIQEIVRYGTNDEEQVSGIVRRSEPYLEVEMKRGFEEGIISTQLVGDYNLPNVLCAIAVGKYFKVGELQIRKAVESYSPSNSRSQLIELKSNHIILDAYNANPSSMKAAIENFSRIPVTDNKKVLLLGAMAELGPESLEEHRRIADLIGEFNWHRVALVGGDFQKIDHPYTRFNNAEEARDWLKEEGIRDAYILIKGSRSMAMEKILDNIV